MSDLTETVPSNVDLVFTPAARQAQAARGSDKLYEKRIAKGFPDTITPELAAYVAERDTAFLATVSAAGAPYIQHRGGPSGFLRVIGNSTLAFADYKGNRQLLSTGNLSVNDRVALFLMNYTHRERLKILGHARIEDVRERPELIERFADPTMRTSVERVVFIDVVSFDWNCPKYITPRYSVKEVEELASSLRTRIAELEAALRAVKS